MLNKLHLSYKITIEDIIFILIAGILICQFSSIITSSPELDCSIKLGRNIIANLDISSVNIITYTAKSTYWVNINWLYDLIIGFLYSLGSYSLIFNLSAILIAAIFSMVFRLMMLKYNNWFINCILLTVGLIASASYLSVSSKLISYLFFVILFILLEKCYQEGFSRNKYVLLFVISLLWANINIDFIMGLVLILSYSFAIYIKYFFNQDVAEKDIAEKYFLGTLLATVATLINPFFYKIYLMPINLFMSNAYQFKGYLASPNFHLFNPFGYFEILILATIFMALFTSYRPSIYKVLIFIVFLMISLYSAVMIPYFVILVLPFLSEVIHNTELNIKSLLIDKLKQLTTTNMSDWKPILSIIFIVMLLLAGIYNIPDYKNNSYQEYFPVKAIKFLKDHNYTGKILAPANWNCFISKNLNCKVFVTSNTFFSDLYAITDFEKIENVYKDFIKTINKHNIQWIIYPEDSFLIQQLQQNTNWQKVYKYKEIVIYKRKHSSSTLNIP